MDSAIAVSVIALVGTVVPAFMTRKRERHKDENDSRRADYQDTQDDLASTRAELRAYRVEAQGQIHALQATAVSLDNEVVVMRADVTSGVIPPLKPRPLSPPLSPSPPPPSKAAGPTPL